MTTETQEQKIGRWLRNALEKGNLDRARRLLEKGADVNMKDHWDDPLLVKACALCNTAVARFLLEHGAEVNVKDRQRSKTPLHFICQYGLLDPAQLLLDAGADVHARNDDGETPLHVAAGQRNTDLIRLLLEHGADVNAKARGDRSPLHVACDMKRLEVVRLLLEKGADVNAKEKLIRELDGSRDGTPLHRACWQRNTDLIRLLLEHGADASVRNDAGDSPAHLAMIISRGYHIQEQILDLFREYAPEAVMEAYCTQKGDAL